MERVSGSPISKEISTRKPTKGIPTPESMLRRSAIFQAIGRSSNSWRLYAAALESLSALELPVTLVVLGTNGSRPDILILPLPDGGSSRIH